MDRIAGKQFLLTGFLEYLVRKRFSSSSSSSPVTVKILTPSDPRERGSQLSLVFSKDVTKVHEAIERRGIVVSSVSMRYLFELNWCMTMRTLLYSTVTNYGFPNIHGI